MMPTVASPVASNRKLDRSLGVSFPGPGDCLLINLVYRPQSLKAARLDDSAVRCRWPAAHRHHGD